jgi:tetratricopeptide (TPR) repeat protein
MREAHLTEEALRHLLAKDHDEIENRLLLHHLAICPDCAAVGGYLLDLYESGALDLRFCIVDAEIAWSRSLAPALLGELSGLSFAEAKRAVQDTSRYRSWGLIEALCLQSVASAPEDAAQAVESAELAVLVARRLPDWQPADPAWVAELRAYALAHLANARRVAGDLPSAAAAMREADRDWLEGFLDVGCDVMGYLPKILALKATLRLEERRFEEALSLFAEAREADTKREIRAEILVGVARAHEVMGNLGKALETLRDAKEAAGGIPSRLHLVIRHNTLWILTSGEEFEAAAALVPEVEELALRFGGALDRLRLEWARARIAAGGGLPEAIEHYEAVRQGFLARTIGYDTALLTLELAVLHGERGERARVREIARDLEGVFAAQDVHREAFAALVLFVRAAEGGDLSVAYLLRLRTYLREAQHDPTRTFAG